MKALIKSMDVSVARGEFATIRLELIVVSDFGQVPSGIFEQFKPGMVLSEFGVGDLDTKETKVSVTKSGRKLYLE